MSGGGAERGKKADAPERIAGCGAPSQDAEIKTQRETKNRRLNRLSYPGAPDLEL